MMAEIKQKISENREKFILGLGALAALVLLSPILANNFLLDQQELSFDASASVLADYNNSTKLGVAAGKQGLAYGKISSGTNSTRFVEVSSEKKAVLDLRSEGNISNYLDYRKGMVIEEPKNISVEFESSKAGNYSGKLFIKARYGAGALGQLWMDIRYP